MENFMQKKHKSKSSNQNRGNPRGMFLLVLLGVAVIAAALVFANQAARQENAGMVGPRLSVDQEVIDFGQVKMGQPVSAEFTLTNTGDSDLRLTKEPYIEVVEGC
jgi:hypothetical protein